MGRFVVLVLVVLASAANAFANSSELPISAPSSDLAPAHYPAPQVTGCQLVGKTFGTLVAGGEIVFKGNRYEVTQSRGTPDKLVYSGPKVRAIFTPKRAGSILEGDDGTPGRIGRDARGTLRIEIGGSVVVTEAREHCVWFE